MGILGPPYCGIGATIRIGREMLCLPYAGFLLDLLDFMKSGDRQLRITYIFSCSLSFLKVDRE